MDFGFVRAARVDGNGVALTFDPARMLTGKQAAAYLEDHPEIEAHDYVIVNDDKATRTLRVLPWATLYGQQLLGPGNGVQTRQISAERLVERVAAHPDGVPVWLEHDGDRKAPVVYLAEQYLP